MRATVEPVDLTCSLSRCIAAIGANASFSGKVRILTAIRSVATTQKSGELCEMITGGTSAEAGGLSLMITNDVHQPLHPTWDELGKVRCSAYRRSGGILSLTADPDGTMASTVREDLPLLPGLLSRSIMILQRIDRKSTGEQNETPAAEHVPNISGYIPAPVNLFEGMSSPLSMFVAVQGRTGNVPPLAASLPRSLGPPDPQILRPRAEKEPKTSLPRSLEPFAETLRRNGLSEEKDGNKVRQSHREYWLAAHPQR